MIIFQKLKNKIKVLLNKIKYFGNARYCPICENYSKKFLKFGNPSRQDAQCPFCYSLERDRLAWLYLKRETTFFEPQAKSMLHVAPEAIFQSHFQRLIKDKYVTADLYRNDVMVKMDITDIQYPDETFDIVYCSHVLEHVPDDKKAMQEFYRVLKPNGWAILLVPIMEGATYEDLSITDPEERLKLYGQEDHVRKYGTDLVYLNRLKEARFKVQIIEPSKFLDNEEIIRMGITKAAQNIYFCAK